MFADLAGFTSLSEVLGEDVVPVLTEYLETASSAVISHRGTIDKFIGDAVMAFWGAPIDNPRHARDACAAALAIQSKMMARQSTLADSDPRKALRARVGVNTGRMLVGNIGSSDRLNYTVIGDAVKWLADLESLNKRYGTSIILGEERGWRPATPSSRVSWIGLRLTAAARGCAITSCWRWPSPVPRDRPAGCQIEMGPGALSRARCAGGAGAVRCRRLAAREGGDLPARDVDRTVPRADWRRRRRQIGRLSRSRWRSSGRFIDGGDDRVAGAKTRPGRPAAAESGTVHGGARPRASVISNVPVVQFREGLDEAAGRGQLPS